ncbi:unnamed protein product [Linum tenue]|uniref:Uncharacterized protein n=1 Tax=Linum tenue TaxID=586396 RepID=A0AAV0LWH9_9ROSI|nr:unnamed protein product [Linum tenue]
MRRQQRIRRRKRGKRRRIIPRETRHHVQQRRDHGPARGDADLDSGRPGSHESLRSQRPRRVPLRQARGARDDPGEERGDSFHREQRYDDVWERAARLYGVEARGGWVDEEPDRGAGWVRDSGQLGFARRGSDPDGDEGDGDGPEGGSGARVAEGELEGDDAGRKRRRGGGDVPGERGVQVCERVEPRGGWRLQFEECLISLIIWESFGA